MSKRKKFDDPFGPAWFGMESYRKFAQSLKSDLRYVRSKAANAFLDDVLASCGSRKIVIAKKTIFWRARLGCETREVETDHDDDVTVVTEEDVPYRRDGMKPISNWQSEGRANPRGIPYLYVATTRDTALSEVRPWIGATVSVAQFRTQRDLTIIDCSKHHSLGSILSLIGDHTRPKEDGAWMAIDQAFAQPVNRDDELKEYIPTQVVAELFKSAGYDGIKYKSLLSKDGYNLALFDLNAANVIQCGLFNTAAINFEFRQAGTEYFCDDQ